MNSFFFINFKHSLGENINVKWVKQNKVQSLPAYLQCVPTGWAELPLRFHTFWQSPSRYKFPSSSNIQCLLYFLQNISASCAFHSCFPSFFPPSPSPSSFACPCWLFLCPSGFPSSSFQQCLGGPWRWHLCLLESSWTSIVSLACLPQPSDRFCDLSYAKISKSPDFMPPLTSIPLWSWVSYNGTQLLWSIEVPLTWRLASKQPRP